MQLARCTPFLFSSPDFCQSIFVTRVRRPRARESTRAREHEQFILDKAIHERLVAMTADPNKLWTERDTRIRERKRLLALLFAVTSHLELKFISL
jgi:hypothetical protein